MKKNALIILKNFIQEARKELYYVRYNIHDSFIWNFIPSNLKYTKIIQVEETKFCEPYQVIHNEPLIIKPDLKEKKVFNLNKVRLSNRNAILPPVNIYKIENCLLFPKTGTYIIDNESIILESQKTLRVARIRSEFNRLKKYSFDLTFQNTTCALFYTKQAGGYYHFLIDHLPRLILLQYIKEHVHVLVPTSLTKVQKEYIELFLPDNCTISYVSSSKAFKCNKAILPNFVTIGGFGFLRKEILSYIKEKIKDKLSITRNDKFNRIYITRRNAKYLKIKNEEDLIFKLREKNFEILDLEFMDITEQIEAFQNAKIIVGAQSSGFANLIYSANAKVIQILWRYKNKPSIGLFDLGICLSVGNEYNPIVIDHPGSLANTFIDIDYVMSEIDKILE